MRDYQPVNTAHDLIIIMSQSFGYFDAQTNRDVLTRLASGLRKGGRIILDLWNPDFFVAHQGARTFHCREGDVHEIKRVKDGKLFVSLEYLVGAKESFEWQLYNLVEMKALARSSGLAINSACVGFDRKRKIDTDDSRIQFVLERLSA